MSPLATQVHTGRTGGLSAAKGRRGRAWEPWGTSPGAYSELAGPFLTKTLLYKTKQNKTAEVVPAPRDRPVSPADRRLSLPRPQPEFSRPRPPWTASGRHIQPVFKRSGA